jgi:hypothetical protein
LRARRSRRALGALPPVILAGSLLVLSARASGPARFEPPTHAGVESYLSESLGLEVEVGLARFDPWCLGLALSEVRLAIGSWRIEIPRLVLRPEWAALLRAELRPVAVATRFVVTTAAVDGASATRLVPELLETLRIPEARVRLSGGELRTRRAEVLLGSLAFSLDGRPGRAVLSLRARQGPGGRLDAQGVLGPAGRGQLGAYLDGLHTPLLRAWLGLALDPAPSALLPPLAGRASGRWHIELRGGEEARHEFALDLRATEPGRGSAWGAEADLRLEGRLGLVGSGAARRLEAGSFARLAGRAGQLNLGPAPGGGGRLFLSGPFEAVVHPFGPVRDLFAVAELRFDEARLALAGLRKPAGLPARVGVVHSPRSGEREPTRFAVALGALELHGALSSDGQLSARSGWLPLPAAAALWPALAGRASDGRVRLVELRGGAGVPGGWQAELELAGVEGDGPRMPLPVHDLAGRVRVDPAGVAAPDLTGRVGGVPLRADLSARRGAGDRWRLRFLAEARQLAVEGGPEAAAAPGRVAERGDLPPALVAAAERYLRRLRELGLSDRIEIERGVLRCARLRARGETLHGVEVDLALRSRRLELARVSFEQAGRRRSYAGSIDLNALLPEVRMAALD